MRKLFITVFLFLCWGLSFAQTRTYADNASNSFVFGLDSYLYGDAGALHFSAFGREFVVSISSGNILVDGAMLSEGVGDTIVGVHDFTGDKEAELVLARRTDSGISATVFAFKGGSWKSLVQISQPGASEIRIFRQVISVRSGEALHSWTWRGGGFDYKSSLQ